MRTLLAATLLLVSTIAAAQDAPKPLSIAIEPLGDRDHGVVARVFFRFANPRAITEAGLFLEGSFIEDGHVPRNFRFAVPRKGDKFIWNNTFSRNGKVVRGHRWAVLPDKRNEVSAVHLFSEGKAKIEVQLILEEDYGRAPVVIAEATETFTLAKTGQPYVVDAADGEPIDIDEEARGEVGSVVIREARRDDESSLFVVTVDALPPVKRVEFRVEDKKVLARNAPPYTAQLDLGDSKERIALRAIGYDAAGRYIDADAFVVNDGDSPITVKITRTVTPDGFAHFKLTVRHRKGSRLKSVALYAGDQKLHEWDRPPFALSMSNASLAGVDFVRAVVVDESGSEASDVLPLASWKPAPHE